MQEQEGTGERAADGMCHALFQTASWLRSSEAAPVRYLSLHANRIYVPAPQGVGFK